MIREQSTAADRHLHEVLLAYVEAVETGQAPDREQLLTKYPDLAEQLREFFAGQDQVNLLAGPLRAPPHPASTAAAAPLGELGDFHLLREVGRGGMGVVYEAEQISLHRRVALKMLPFAAALDPRQLQRFRIEAQAAAKLHHTNIVPVFAVGSERGVHYYAMQFIDGQSLAALIAELRQPVALDATATTASPLVAALSTARSSKPREFFNSVARLGKQAADALEHAHQMGIVHRDIKPANLLLDERGQLWVTDFGLAQFRSDTELTATGEVLGTLRYASPEQARARPDVVDQRSDIYSLGATLYELLTLHPVFNGADRGELLRQMTFDEPAAPRSLNRAIPVELETIVLKALSKAPVERYTSAKELADDLQRFLDDKPILARRPSLAERAAKWSRRHRQVVYSAVILLAVGVMALSVGTLLIANAYARERVKAEEARKAQARAEDNYRRAKRAVDLLTQLSEEEMLGMPGLQGVRRTMLDAALTYYQEFLDQHLGDPDNQPELAASHARVTRLLAELSALQGHAEMMLLSDWAVQDDLKATQDQRWQIRELTDKMAAQWGTTSRELNKEQRHTKLVELAGEHEKAVAALLTPKQHRRLQQIGLQVRNRGPDGFRDPEITAALKITAKQQQAIRRIQEAAMSKWVGGPPTKGKGGPPKHHMDDWMEKMHQDVMLVLTADQQALWRDLTAEPFAGGNFMWPGMFGGKGPPPPKGPKK